MKYVLLAFFLGGVMIAQAGLSRLEALSMIETADNDKTIGSAGEMSRYQIMPRTWKQYTQSEDYQNPAVSGWVAARHVQWLDTTFRAKTGRAWLLRKKRVQPREGSGLDPGSCGTIPESARDEESAIASTNPPNLRPPSAQVNSCCFEWAHLSCRRRGSSQF